MLDRLLTSVTVHMGMTTDRHCQNSGSQKVLRKAVCTVGIAK